MKLAPIQGVSVNTNTLFLVVSFFSIQPPTSFSMTSPYLTSSSNQSTEPANSPVEDMPESQKASITSKPSKPRSAAAPAAVIPISSPKKRAKRSVTESSKQASSPAKKKKVSTSVSKKPKSDVNPVVEGKAQGKTKSSSLPKRSKTESVSPKVGSSTLKSSRTSKKSTSTKSSPKVKPSAGATKKKEPEVKASSPSALSPNKTDFSSLIVEALKAAGDKKGLSKKSLLSYLKQKAGEDYSETAISEALENGIKTGLFKLPKGVGGSIFLKDPEMKAPIKKTLPKTTSATETKVSKSPSKNKAAPSSSPMKAESKKSTTKAVESNVTKSSRKKSSSKKTLSSAPVEEAQTNKRKAPK
jgi:linker histone H1 and H5 family